MLIRAQPTADESSSTTTNTLRQGDVDRHGAWMWTKTRLANAEFLGPVVKFMFLVDVDARPGGPDLVSADR